MHSFPVCILKIIVPNRTTVLVEIRHCSSWCQLRIKDLNIINWKVPRVKRQSRLASVSSSPIHYYVLLKSTISCEQTHKLYYKKDIYRCIYKRIKCLQDEESFFAVAFFAIIVASRVNFSFFANVAEPIENLSKTCTVRELLMSFTIVNV